MPVEGYIPAANGGLACPILKCRAVCCRVQHFRPDRSPPCEYLQSDCCCELHVAGGPPCKPQGCNDYPRSNDDIEEINTLAKKMGFTERCLLKVI